MNSIDKAIKILEKYPDLGDFDGHYTVKKFFVKNGQLKIYHNSYDYHGKSGDGFTESATEKQAAEILERLEERLSKILRRSISKQMVKEFYS